MDAIVECLKQNVWYAYPGGGGGGGGGGGAPHLVRDCAGNIV